MPTWKHVTRAGRLIPLAWHGGVFPVVLEGYEVRVRGMVSPPFAYFRGTADGPVAGHKFTLVHLPSGKLIATLRRSQQARTLAAELAPIYARDESSGASVVARHGQEQA